MIEVMCHDCGYLALMAGLAGGTEAIVILEVEFDPRSLGNCTAQRLRAGQAHALMVAAEGACLLLQ